MTVVQLVPHLVALALLALATWLALREGYRTHTHPGHRQHRPHSRHIGTAHQDHDAIKEHDMTHRTNAEGSIDAARATLAELTGQRTPTDITRANAARAQAIATAAVAQALLALDDTLKAAHAAEESTA